MRQLNDSIAAVSGAEKSEQEHVEVIASETDAPTVLDHERLVYGKTGVAGILTSPFIFGVACLASL